MNYIIVISYSFINQGPDDFTYTHCNYCYWIVNTLLHRQFTITQTYRDGFQNLLIERKGRRFMLMGGFILMTVWAVVFTVALLSAVSHLIILIHRRGTWQIFTSHLVIIVCLVSEQIRVRGSKRKLQDPNYSLWSHFVSRPIVRLCC